MNKVLPLSFSTDLVPIEKIFVSQSHHIYFCHFILFSTNFAPHFFLNNLFKKYFLYDKKTPVEYFLKYFVYSILYDFAVDDFLQSVLGNVSYSL